MHQNKGADSTGEACDRSSFPKIPAGVGVKFHHPTRDRKPIQRVTIWHTFILHVIIRKFVLPLISSTVQLSISLLLRTPAVRIETQNSGLEVST